MTDLPIGYFYEAARAVRRSEDGTATYDNWYALITFESPDPHPGVRNIRPLFGPDRKTVPKVDYDLCDQENSNLRRLLLWAAGHLTAEQKKELAAKIKALLDVGGITDDPSEDAREVLRNLYGSMNKLMDRLDEAMLQTSDHGSILKASQAATLSVDVRGFMTQYEEVIGLNMHDIRSLGMTTTLSLTPERGESNAILHEALGLFRSAILSGESWSPTCQAVFDHAKERLASRAAAPDAGADEVTDVMVEIACQAYAKSYSDGASRAGSQGMEAALRAALSARPRQDAPRDQGRLLGWVDGAWRIVMWGKASHVPMWGWCLADQGAEDFDLCEPTWLHPLPAAPSART